MGYMKTIWMQQHDIDEWARQRRHEARSKHRMGLITTREFDLARAEIEIMTEALRRELLADFLGE